jgi:hypothetical protein
MELGGHRVPGRWASFLRCWGDIDPATRHQLYSTSHYYCASRDALFLSDEHETGIVRYQHLFTQSDELNTFRFWSRQEHLFEQTASDNSEGIDVLDAGERDVTSYRCRQSFVGQDGHVSRVVLCARALRRFPGLYDLTMRVVTLTGARSAVQTRLVLSGFGLDNGLAIARRYAEAVTWP